MSPGAPRNRGSGLRILTLAEATMVRKSQKKKEKSDLEIIKAHTTALKSHTKALNESRDALRNNTAAIAAALVANKQSKPLPIKTSDAIDCMSAWLQGAKGVPQIASLDQTKNMSTDFHVAGYVEMMKCLKWVQICLSKKGDVYHLDTISPGATKHLIDLAGGTLGAVVSDIVSNMG
jgi:hypothetical protein